MTCLTQTNPIRKLKLDIQVIHHAHVLTQDPRRPEAEGIVIRGDRILAVGSLAEIEPYREHADVQMDARGAVVAPGFIDTHVHLSVSGLGMLAVDLSGVDAIGTALDRIAHGAANAAPGALILAVNFQPEINAERRFPTPEEIDRACGGRPVYLMDRTGHWCAVNRATLELLQLTVNHTGVTCREDGQFSGVLTDSANTCAFTQLWPRFAEEIGEERAFELAARDAVRGGVTSLHALDDLVSVRRLLACQERLPVRVRPYTQTRSVEKVRALGLKQIGGCGTVMLDGDFDPHTAALHEAYTDEPQTRGKLYYSDTELNDYIEEAHRAGLQIALHCVGSAAIEQLLNAYERSLIRYPRADHRHRIEHFELPEPGQAERARRLGVCLAVQPSFNHYWPHTSGYPELVGAERAERVDPLASLMGLDIAMGLGSDSPVTPLRPLLWIHSAVNHSNPRERISAAAALALATRGGSYLGFEESLKGTLEPGKLADLVWMDQDPCKAPAELIGDICVLKTMVGGKIVFSTEEETE
jgi:predicted amidohydrolase YtcJ